KDRRGRCDLPTGGVAKCSTESLQSVQRQPGHDAPPRQVFEPLDPRTGRLRVKRSRTPRPRHFIDAAGPLAVLERVIGSDAAVAKLLDVDRSEPRSWREGQVPDPETASRVTVLATVVEVLVPSFPPRPSQCGSTGRMPTSAIGRRCTCTRGET